MNSTTEMKDDDKFNQTDLFNIFNNTASTEISKILTTSESESAKPLWFQIMDILALFILSCGFMANLGTIYILSRGSKLFTPAVRILLRHQAGIDAFCSVCAIILIVQPPFWLTGWAHWFDTIICHLWHAQFIYWSAMFISIWNLMFVAVERYIAVCHPFKHALIKNSHVRKCILGLYIMNIVLHWGYIQVHMEGDKCTLGFWIQGELGEKMFKSFVVMAFLLYYAIPVLTFIICYGMIIFTMKRRQSQDEMGTHSRLIDSATKQLIKTAITVTVVFMISLGYEVWTFFLGNLGLVTFYTKYQNIQKVGIWIAALNPTANPFAYFVLIPKYRRKVLRTFLPCFTPDNNQKESSGDSSISGTGKGVTVTGNEVNITGNGLDKMKA